MSVDNRRFRRAARVRGAVVLAAAVLGVAGCSGSTEGSPTAVESAATSPDSGQTSGSATASTSAKSDEAALWDPCTLPESALSATGINPGTKESGIADVDFSGAGWNICQWTANDGWYWLTVLVGPPTLEQVEARTDFGEFTATTVDSQSALRFRKPGARRDLACYIAVEVPHGTATFKASARASIGAKEDMCSVANRHTSDLGGYLPE
ncbi:DUF3558 domain-containing protein [Nocardia cyriacigeorgica]|uniref:DUF3558 domain-containing protein n=1 Tax=Nocardia cyriacigeorgica TaxID=135487 RepID=UPI0024568C3E|nr:DUF3558 domain-containing protein [Nocardia cyriacigeorgica]